MPSTSRLSIGPAEEIKSTGNENSNSKMITEKDFYKAMQKIKDRAAGSKPPKRPASAYILFQKQVSEKLILTISVQKRAEILKRQPNSKVTEVVKEIARCWRALTKEQRVPYKDQARKGKNFVILTFSTDKDRYESQI